MVQKQQYMVGEPIMLIFRVRDTGSRPVSLSDSDPYGECSPYHVAIDPSQEPNPEPNSGPRAQRSSRLKNRIAFLVDSISHQDRM